VTKEEWDKLTPDEQWTEYHKMSKQFKPPPIFGFEKMEVLVVKSIYPAGDTTFPPRSNDPDTWSKSDFESSEMKDA